MSDFSNRLSGFYKAIVTDVSSFPKTGKIKTRIAAFRGNSVPSSLTTESYRAEDFKASTDKDIYTSILVPFGGGLNTGAFKLPEVNSLGVVTFINNNPNMPIWIGGISAYYMNEGSLISVDYPSDKLDNNRGMLYKEEGEADLTPNYEDENSFVLKTKTNVLPDFTKPETMDWSKNPVENAVILNAAKAQVYHRIADSEYIDFVMKGDEKDDKNEPEISLGLFNDEENSSSHIKLNDKVELIRSEEGASSTILIDSDSKYGINIQSVDSSGNSGESIGRINITPTEVVVSVGGSLTGGSSSITLSRINDEISISAKSIRLSASTISLGDTGYYVVTSPTNVSMTLEDGTLLTTAHNIKV